MGLINNANISDKACILLALCNACIASSVLLMEQEYEPIRLTAIISICILFVLIWSKNNNILFLVRTLVLGGVGYFPMIIKVLLGPESYFSWFEKSTQTFDIVILMYIATSIAILGSEIGLYLGSKNNYSFDQKAEHADESLFWKIIYIFSIPIVLWSSYEAFKVGGLSVLDAAYTSKSEEASLGIYAAAGIVCLLAMWVACLKCYFKYCYVIFYSLAVYFLIFSLLLRGARQDVLTPILGMLVCYSLVKHQSFKITFKSLVLGTLLLTVIEIWGVAREVISSKGFDISYFVSTAISDRTNVTDSINFGTVSPIATTFSNMVWLIESGKRELIWGKSYWEYILRTPPHFMYPNRPEDYAWIFSDYDLIAAGGFFELAETYMNFGLVGGLFISLIISYLLSKSYFYTLNKQTVFSYFLLFSFLGVFLRGTWYQTFAFYKCFLLSLMLYTLFLYIYKLSKKT